jgi:methionine-rich copper-binding protein CopC
MPREFDTFIIVPAFANQALKSYSDYLDSEIGEYPEQIALYFDSISASYVHDATSKEEALIKEIESADKDLKIALEKELPEGMHIGQNVMIKSLHIISGEDSLLFKLQNPDGFYLEVKYQNGTFTPSKH